MTTTTTPAQALARRLYLDDLSRADVVPVERDGLTAYHGWARASAMAADCATIRALREVDADDFAREWEALVAAHDAEA